MEGERGESMEKTNEHETDDDREAGDLCAIGIRIGFVRKARGIGGILCSQEAPDFPHGTNPGRRPRRRTSHGGLQG